MNHRERSLLWERSRDRGLAESWRALRQKRDILRRTSVRKLANLVRVKIEKRTRRLRVRGLPYRFKVDPGNVCRLRCPLCPTGRGDPGRPVGFMGMPAYRRILSQIAPWAVTLDLFGWGEPLLHPRIAEMIALPAAQGIYTRLSTSFNTTDPDLPATLAGTGLDALIIGLDGADPAQYRLYRRGGDLELVAGNIRRLVAARNRAGGTHPLIIARMLVHRGNEHAIARTRRLAHDLGADVFTVSPVFLNPADREQMARWRPRAGHVDAYAAGPHNRGQCRDLWESLVINPDGGISPCCWIHRRDRDLGNILETPLRQLWNGPAFQAARAAVLEHEVEERGPWTYCRDCRGFPDYLAPGESPPHRRLRRKEAGREMPGVW